MSFIKAYIQIKSTELNRWIFHYYLVHIKITLSIALSFDIVTSSYTKCILYKVYSLRLFSFIFFFGSLLPLLPSLPMKFMQKYFAYNVYLPFKFQTFISIIEDNSDIRIIMHIPWLTRAFKNIYIISEFLIMNVK